MEGERAFGVRTLCRALDVSPSGFYARRKHRPSDREVDNQRLLRRIQSLHEETHEAYGTERMWRALRKEMKPEQRVRVLRALYALSLERGQLSDSEVEQVMSVAIAR